MHVEFVGQDLERDPLLCWPFGPERLGSLEYGLWRGPSAGIPGTESLDSQAACGSRAMSMWVEPSVTTTMPLVRRDMK